MSGNAQLVLRALEKIFTECGKDESMFNRLSATQKSLRATCTTAINAIKADPDTDAESCAKPLRDACKSKLPGVMVIAIDCLSKLMAYGFLKMPLDDMQAAGGGKTLMDVVVEAVCECSHETDDGVQLQVLQALLTAVTSEKCEVHDTQLQLAVRTCCHIHLTTKNQANQAIARGALSQMLTAVFDNMEKHFSLKAAAAIPEQPDNASGCPPEAGSSEEAASVEEAPADQVAEIAAAIEDAVEPAAEDAEPAAEDAVEPAASPSPASVSESTEALKDLEIGRDRSESQLKDGDARGDVLMKDAILLFRALCKLAMKPLLEGVTIENVSMRMKILSLELLDGLLQSAGPVFKSSERCIFAVKQYLCMSLVQNSISAVPAIFKLIIKIFDTLLHHFKQNLKAEVGIFFNSVLLRTLDTDHSSFVMKLLVLQTVNTFVTDSRNLVELFVNYDCDLDFDDLYEALVNTLSKIAQGVHVKNAGLLPAQEEELMHAALASLVLIATSMAQWVDAMTGPSNKGSNTEADGDQDSDEEADEAAKQANDEAANFDDKRKEKHIIVKGLEMFADNPSSGVKYFVSKGYCEMTAASVAKFFHEFKGLGKNSIGQYIGRSKTFNKEVLNAFTDYLDFEAASYIEAIRMFLNAFRLPGEAGMIVPIMEKFAEKYFQVIKACRPESEQYFKNADAAYVLSYSIMMLNTDLHHPEVKERMTQMQFRNNLRGVNDGGDLDGEFLDGIYFSIRDDEIKLKDDDISWYNLEGGNQATSAMDPKMRAMKWEEESANAIQRMKMTMDAKSRTASDYHVASHSEHVRPMFEVSRWPFLSGFSQYLEQTTEQDVCNLCLGGFKAAIHISCIFFMSTERDAFITSLSKFTQLSTMREMNGKSVLVINTLLNIAITEANFLQSTWKQVLTCISQVERLRMISEGAPDEMTIFGGGNSKSKPAPRGSNLDDEGRNAGFLTPCDSKEDAQRIMNEINVSHIEAVFVNSQHYTSECIVDFVNELCLVALDEIHNPKEPRIFASQKIVEVAHYNMDRIRIVWLRIWQLMSQHFFKAGCHPNSHISMYAIDSLRQLAIKFLSKDELESFTFQKDFLNPFVLILQNNDTEDAHEIVIRCFEQVVQAKAAKLRSGWETILTVLSLTANDNFPSMLTVGFQVLENLLTNYLGGVSEYWEQLIECLTAFALNPHDTTVGNKAIKHLKGLCEKLVEGSIASCSPNEHGGFSFSEGHGKGWCTLLSAFRVIAWDSRAAIGYQGVEAMFGVLIEHGALWDTEVWQMVLKQVVFETINAAKGTKDTPALEKQRQEWISKSCGSAVTLLIDVFAHHLERLQPLWEDLVMYMYGLVAQPDLALALEGMNMLEYLVNSLGDKISDELWDTLLKVVGLIFETSTPREFVDAAVKSAAADEEALDMTATPKNSPMHPPTTLANLDGETPSPGSESNKWEPPTAVQFNAMTLMCTVQLLLIKVTGEIYESHGSRLLSRHILVLVECLEGACKFAHDFNMNRGARTKLWNPELPGLQKLPDLIEQETSALKVYLTILSNLYCETEVEVEVRREIAESRLLSTVDTITSRYIAKTLKPTMLPEEMPEMMAFTSVIVQILTAVKNFDDEQFQRHLGDHIYPNVVELTECGKIEVRRPVREILIRIGKVLQISDKLPKP